MEHFDSYKTTDIVLAATLCLDGHEVKNIECDGNKGTFCFENIPSELISTFDRGAARVEPVAFNGAIRRLTTAVKRNIHGG